ncbi:hypothetical protein LEP1GSC083_3334 [Leptospira interrogans serovar Pyrogenes str. L0374]|uniref:Uncharacterized protein n=1 Tax=Leptospira interrogans serovar Pyrogenes str. L0374 TaxID=1049928 RepID=M6K1S1_LEPIR|nr:hypothetical protein LEP1GSC077_2747 [Leptospira interrogans str. C10069]EMN28051.1 hypothetical protein LEP1GSC083_3334 [Leptospira interrogans serovar Pyrogenes str. L0374]EMN63661.1 hypothetical protein LEP1GSC092_0996 [Leptospira interrogans serovar Pyrogenes str. R168]
MDGDFFLDFIEVTEKKENRERQFFFQRFYSKERKNSKYLVQKPKK